MIFRGYSRLAIPLAAEGSAVVRGLFGLVEELFEAGVVVVSLGNIRSRGRRITWEQQAHEGDQSHDQHHHKELESHPNLLSLWLLGLTFSPLVVMLVILLGLLSYIGFWELCMGYCRMVDGCVP